MPELDYMLLADYVRQDASGFITIVGAGIDTIVAPAIPSSQSIGIALRMTFGTTEQVGEPHHLRLMFQGPDGHLMDLGAPFVTPPQPPDIPEHWRTAVWLALRVTLPLPTYGDYSFDLDVDDGQITKSIDIRVIPPPPGGPHA
jgi:hypothetical protein